MLEEVFDTIDALSPTHVSSTRIVDDAMVAAVSILYRPRAPVLGARMHSPLNVKLLFCCTRSGGTKWLPSGGSGS